MKKIIIFTYFLFLVSLCLIYFVFNKQKNYEIIDNSFKTIKVDIKGAVSNPGVKEVLYGSTVSDLIANSGGLLDGADTSKINLSKKLNDEDVIIIYNQNEIKNNDLEIQIVDKECICPVINNNACINPNFIDALQTNNLISLNSGTLEQLMTLPGIGKSKAEAIIKYRENNLFNSIEDIMNIKGIGNSIFEKIKNYISI